MQGVCFATYRTVFEVLRNKYPRRSSKSGWFREMLRLIKAPQSLPLPGRGATGQAHTRFKALLPSSSRDTALSLLGTRQGGFRPLAGWRGSILTGTAANGAGPKLLTVGHAIGKSSGDEVDEHESMPLVSRGRSGRRYQAGVATGRIECCEDEADGS